MTKEELEKEAGNYADKHAFRVPYDGSNKFYDDVDFKASKEGYLAGAEPREKRIAELEVRIEKLIDFATERTECCDVCPITDTCINSEGTCPYAGILSKDEEAVTRKWIIRKTSKEIKEK